MTKIDLENVICFQTNWDLYQKCLALPETMKESLRKPNVIEAVEADVQIWMKLMERVRQCLIMSLNVNESFVIVKIVSGCCPEPAIAQGNRNRGTIRGTCVLATTTCAVFIDNESHKVCLHSVVHTIVNGGEIETYQGINN